MIRIVQNTDRTISCNGCSAASYARYGVEPTLTPEQFAVVSVGRSVGRPTLSFILCPACLTELADQSHAAAEDGPYPDTALAADEAEARQEARVRDAMEGRGNARFVR